ncbi:hypothetical protein KFU94_48115 [Chloroflexi bacterium TSY]|nr:hypothetical protein [Chloroflexi bacterium TSY]
MLRSLIAKVILTPKDRITIEVKIVWLSGHYSLFAANRPFQKWEEVPFYPEMLKRIHQLWEQGASDSDIAELLNKEAFTAMDGSALTHAIIRNLRLRQGWSVRPAGKQTPPKVDGKFTARGLAIECGADKEWVRRQIFRGAIPPEVVTRHPHQRCYLIDASDQLIKQLKAKALHRKRYKMRKHKATDA